MVAMFPVADRPGRASVSSHQTRLPSAPTKSLREYPSQPSARYAVWACWLTSSSVLAGRSAGQLLVKALGSFLVG